MTRKRELEELLELKAGLMRQLLEEKAHGDEADRCINCNSDEHKTGASGKTVFSCEEPPDNKPLVLNPLKEWSGGGDQSSRVNHGNEQNFINTPTVLIGFNEVTSADRIFFTISCMYSS